MKLTCHRWLCHSFLPHCLFSSIQPCSYKHQQWCTWESRLFHAIDNSGFNFSNFFGVVDLFSFKHRCYWLAITRTQTMLTTDVHSCCSNAITTALTFFSSFIVVIVEPLSPIHQVSLLPVIPFYPSVTMKIGCIASFLWFYPLLRWSKVSVHCIYLFFAL